MIPGVPGLYTIPYKFFLVFQFHRLVNSQPLFVEGVDEDT